MWHGGCGVHGGSELECETAVLGDGKGIGEIIEGVGAVWWEEEIPTW